MTRVVTRLPFALLIAATPSCVSTPPIAVVSSNTALMAQAAGEMPQAEYDVTQAGLQPGPEPTPREKLPEDDGTPFAQALQIHKLHEGDWRTVDELLRAHCVGEANTGLLSSRSAEEGCTAEVDVAAVSLVVGRMNVHRRQLWTALANEHSAKVDAVRSTWLELHIERLVCGAMVQGADWEWGEKEC